MFDKSSINLMLRSGSVQQNANQGQDSSDEDKSDDLESIEILSKKKTQTPWYQVPKAERI